MTHYTAADVDGFVAALTDSQRDNLRDAIRRYQRAANHREFIAALRDRVKDGYDGIPVVGVVFTTCDYDDGVYLDGDGATTILADGTECDSDDSDAFGYEETVIKDYLTDMYGRVANGGALTVNLLTGDMEYEDYGADAVSDFKATLPPYVRTLVWEAAGNDGADTDQNADSGHTAMGCTSMYWSLGPNGADRWGVELIGVSHGEEQPLAGINLGSFSTEADAKAAAQTYENKTGDVATNVQKAA